MNLQTQYNQAASALSVLGYSKNLPSLPRIKKAFTAEQLAYTTKHKATLVITPPSNLYDLIKAFDKKQKTESYIYKYLLDQYDLSSDKWRVDFVLPDLMFTSQTSDEQKKSLRKQQKNYKVGLQSIDPRTYVMLDAIRIENGEKLLDGTTFTRFAQLPMKTSGGYSWVPRVDSVGGRVYLDRSRGRAYSYEGLRASVGLELNTSTSPLPDSFSSELPEELTINGKMYRAV